MEIPGVRRAYLEISPQVQGLLGYLRSSANPNDWAYSVALVTTDDFSYTMLCANSDSHLASRHRERQEADTAGKMRDKWHFGQWQICGDEVNTEALDALLPADPMYDEPRYSAMRGALRLWVLTLVLQHAIKEVRLAQVDRPVVAFCSIVDSSDAVWLEFESARLVNAPEVFIAFSQERKEAADWYGQVPEEPSALRLAFDRFAGKRL